MIVRSAGTTSNTNLINGITSQQNRLYELYNKINDPNQLKYQNISENPIDAADLLRIDKQLSEIEAYTKNINDARTQINQQDSVFSTIVEKLQRLNELAIQAANTPSGEEGFKACAIEMEQITQNIIDLANTQYDGKYIFAGTNVTTQPFTMTDDGSIVYNGTPEGNSAGYQRSLDISDDVKIELNSSGDTIFGTYDSQDPTKSSGLFKVLGDLNKIMKTAPMDNEAVKNELDNIQDGIKNISQIQAKHSSTAAKLTMTENILEESQLTLTSKHAEIGEINLPETISELVQQTYAMQASMQAYSLISNKSLLDYI